MPLLGFIPIQQDASGGVEFELVTLLESTPTVVVSLRVEDDFRLWSSGEIIEEDKVGGSVKLLGADAVLGQGKLDAADL